MYQKRKISLMLSIILILQIILPILNVVIENAMISKAIAYSGTEYYINTAQDMWDFAALVNNGDTFKGVTVCLTADIDLGCDENNQWIPIGDYSSNSANIFKGIFDGNNHTISGIYIEKTNDYQGLFGVNHEGIIKNVSINNSNINAINSVGGIAGYNYKGTIYNCRYDGAIICGIVSGSSAHGGGTTGGIVGYNYKGTVEKCYNNATIDNTKAGGNQIGGIVGICKGGTVIDCYNTGKMYGTTFGGIVGEVWRGANIKRCYNNASLKGCVIGGIVEYAKYATIEECYNTGNIGGTYNVGGIVGQTGKWEETDVVIVKNCYNTGKVTANERVGGIIGSLNTGAKTEVSNCYNVGNVTGETKAGGISGYNLESKINNCYYLNYTASGAVNGIDDTTNNVVSIEENILTSNVFLTRLNNLDNKWIFLNENIYKYPVLNWQTNITLAPELTQDKYYIYTEQDLLDFATIVNDGENCENKIVYLMSDIQITSNETNKWKAIGTSKYLAFQGTFEGNNNKISGMNTVGGFFGYIGENGVVENLTIENSTILGGGGIASYNNGLINNCTNKSNITGSTYCGGIAGQNLGIINNCQNYGNIVGDTLVGGITGINGGARVGEVGKIFNCYNVCNVSGTGNYIGGITGGNNDTIQNCYNIGTIAGQAESFGTGGIDGYCQGLIENCYNIGVVTGKYPGGITGGTNGEIGINNCYYLETTATYEKGYDKGFSGKLTFEEMKNLSFVNLLNSNIDSNLTRWMLDIDNINNGYPIFVSQGENKELTEIAVTTAPTKTSYVAGQNFETAGMVVTASYNDGSSIAVTNYTVTDGDNLTAGKTSVTISYTEGNITKTTIQNITVSEKLSIETHDLEEVKKDGKIYIKSINPGETVESLTEKIDTNGQIEIFKGTEKITNENTKLSTGMTLKIFLNDEQIEYTIVVTGDLNGDGEMGDIDVLRLARYRAGLDNNLTGAYLQASNIFKDDNYADDIDLLKMVRILVGLDSLTK